VAAKEYQNIHGQSRFRVPRITGNRAQLMLQGRTVTHHYVCHIRHAYCTPQLKAYIGQSNQWLSSVMAHADWKTLGAACDLHHDQRHFISN
jgi:hypothetical protein